MLKCLAPNSSFFQYLGILQTSEYRTVHEFSGQKKEEIGMVLTLKRMLVYSLLGVKNTNCGSMPEQFSPDPPGFQTRSGSKKKADLLDNS